MTKPTCLRIPRCEYGPGALCSSDCDCGCHKPTGLTDEQIDEIIEAADTNPEDARVLVRRVEAIVRKDCEIPRNMFCPNCGNVQARRGGR